MTISDLLISPAWAQAGAGEEGGILGAFVPLILIFVVFYFLLIRPQQKKQKEHQRKISAICRGDKILTNGGIFGVVTRLTSEMEVEVEIANGVRVQVSRPLIADIINPKAAATTPANNSENASPSGGLLGKLFGANAQNNNRVGAEKPTPKAKENKSATHKKAGAKKASAKKASAKRGAAKKA